MGSPLALPAAPDAAGVPAVRSVADPKPTKHFINQTHILATPRCCSAPKGGLGAILYLHMYIIPKNASVIMIALTDIQTWHVVRRGLQNEEPDSQC